MKNIVRLAKTNENEVGFPKLIQELITGVREKIKNNSLEHSAVPSIFQRSKFLSSFPNSKATLLNELETRYKKRTKRLKKGKKQALKEKKDNIHTLQRLNACFVFSY